ncbi:MAG: TRAM domain-containing protein, partial [Candidatus Firestonebacteria bacterium]
MNQPIRTGETVKIKIDALAYSPDGVGKVDNFIVFVPYSAPGDELEIMITEVRKNFARGKIVKILVPSPDRAETVCPVFGECGGCHWQHIKYSKQLEYKEDIVRKALRKFPAVKIEKTIPAKSHYYYRNKSQFPVDNERKKIGLYALKSHFVIDVENCPLILSNLNEVYGFIKKYLVEHDYPAKNLRHVVLRGSETKGGITVIFVLRDDSVSAVTELANKLRENFKDISVLFNINDTETNIIMGRQTIMMFGDGVLTEEWKDV